MVYVYGTLVVGITAALMIFARRYNNDNDHVGRGIAAWAIIIILIIWLAGIDGAL